MLLDKQQIHNKLFAEGFETPYELHLFDTIDSTNLYLKNLPLSDRLAICCAEEQTQGRGRFERVWHSPFAENIYCSIRWNLPCAFNTLSGLPLIVSLAVLSTINELGLVNGLKIKWPNDILWEDKKLCGNLIECLNTSTEYTQVVIGIGLNVNSDTENQPLIDKPWCSLYTIHKKRFNRNLIISRLIMNLERYLMQLCQNGLGSFIEEWVQSDYLMGKHITITQPSTQLSGKACGITPEGLLIVEDSEGALHYIHSGDASLKTLS